jgi:hypothetical protein
MKTISISPTEKSLNVYLTSVVNDSQEDVVIALRELVDAGGIASLTDEEALTIGDQITREAITNLIS